MRQDQPAMPALPSPATATTTVPAVPVPPATAREMYEAMRAQRQVLDNQLSGVKSDRRSIAEALRNGNVMGADREGLEARLKAADARILDLEGQVARAEAQEAAAAGLPGATTESPEKREQEMVEAALAIGAVLLFVFAIPMSIAWARRIWRKNAVTIVLPPELTGRLEAIERGIDSTAIEVERIGEGQRFVTQLLAQRPEGASLPAGERRDAR